MVTVTAVAPRSIADRVGICPEDILLEINGHPISDVLDYRFFLTERRIVLKIHRGAELLEFPITKGEYEDIGLEFSTFLMDEKRRCSNKCIFCFIDQLTKGLRKTLYFKDDDSRLSFLLGNYVTLTNLSDAEIDRIVEMKLSPLHISVHTTNPKLRVEMMKNPNAAKIMDQLHRFAQANLTLNCQIVLCRGINDGAELERTLQELSALPGIESVAIVPSGLTDHREGLPTLQPFDAESARAVIRQVEAMAKKCKKTCGSRIFFCSDEFYILAGLPVHTESYYEGYPQLENGVGMMTSLRTEFRDALKDADADPNLIREISVATGVAAYDYMCGLVTELQQKFPGCRCHVYRIENKFFGKQITVAGLLCGCDLEAQLKDKPLGQRLFLPATCLRHERDLFLDGMSAQALEDALHTPITFTECDGYALLSDLLKA